MSESWPDHPDCPVCGRRYVRLGRDPLMPMECASGHEWHRCPVHGVAVAGRADLTGDTFRCRCGPKKEDSRR